MPNWCDTTYKIVGNEAELKELKSILDRMSRRDNPLHENDFGNMWLGDFIVELGKDWSSHRCRGWIEYYDYNDGVLTIYQSTAWCEQEDVRYAIMDNFPSLTVYFLEDEPGCGVFYTNDEFHSYFKEKYRVCICIEDKEFYETDYFENFDSIARYIKSTFDADVNPNYEDICKFLQSITIGEDNFFSIDEFEYVEQ